MKVENVLLDIAAGDASVEDAFIADAIGKINVSSAIFEAAYEISELPSEDIPYIQEAADEQKIPTDKEGSVGVANESVCQELGAFFDQITLSAKKIKESTNKSLGVLRAIGKKLGVNASSDYLNGFVVPLKTAFKNANPKGLEIQSEGGAFIKSRYASRMAENYCKGMSNILAAYGISMSDVMNNDTVKLIVRSNIKVRGDVKDLRDVESNLNVGGKQLSFDKVIGKDSHYTTTVKADDIGAFAVALYTVYATADAVSKMAGKKKSAMSSLRGFVDDTKKAGRVSRSCESINDGVKEWSSNLKSLTDNINKAFNDSIYHLSASFGGKSKK